MIEMQEAVADATRELITNGTFRKMIAEQVHKTLAELVRNALAPYSPFGKQMGEAIAAALSIDPESLGLHGYNLTVLAIIKERLEMAIETVGRQKLTKDMDEMLGVAAPRRSY